MAQTQEFYRLAGRNPRFTTKLNSFANGMYLTNQVIPEGYVKAMVNYDIDDTGSNIKPRRGRELVQVVDGFVSTGPATLTDYIYAYNQEGTEVEATKDVVLSYGSCSKVSDLIEQDAIDPNRRMYIFKMEHEVNKAVYDFVDGEYVEVAFGPSEIGFIDDFWGLHYDSSEEKFKAIHNEDIGYVAARSINNAYAFDKPFVSGVGRPISTVLNNEIITFAGPKVDVVEYTANPERNEIRNLGDPELTKVMLTRNEAGDYTIKRKVLTPRDLNPLEALSSGYNILSSEPYTFTDEPGGTVAVLGMLMYEDDKSTIPVFSPELGKSVTIRTYYQYPELEETDTTKIQQKIEILNAQSTSEEWEVLKDFPGKDDEDQGFTPGDKILHTFIPKYKSFLYRVTLRLGDDEKTEYPYFILIQCGDTTYDNLKNKTFKLSDCKGMISWQSCVGVYGLPEAPNTIFFSDVEDPSYFPFPNNTMAFDNDILAVHNYLDNLVVVTIDSIWLVVAGTTIGTSIQKRILANIHIPEIDAINLVVLKDQIFFKTDTQFYVLKPNQYTSDATDLKNYVNSTAISNYTADFKKETVALLNKVFVELTQEQTKAWHKEIKFVDFDVLDTVSIVRDSEVHYIYTIVPKLNEPITFDRLNLHLVYNTLSRSWRMYFVAIGDERTQYAPVLYKNKQSGAFYEFFPHASSSGGRVVITKQTYDTVTDNVVDGKWQITTRYDNFNYIDTGNIAVDDVSTKRFRETQFNLLNLNGQAVRFYTNFFVDGQEHIDSTNYEVQHITDPDDTDYGKIYVTPVEQSNLMLPGTTELADVETEINHWTLDSSKFPDLSLATVRLQLQGRGYRCSLQLLNTSLKRYELSELKWVYRIMSAR